MFPGALPQRIHAVLKEKGVQPSKVYLIKCPVSVYIEDYTISSMLILHSKYKGQKGEPKSL